MKALNIVCLILVSVAMTAASAASTLYCSQCRKKISGQYLKSNDGRVYCGRSCAEKRLPKCSTCSKRISGRSLSLKGKVFCSDRCLESIMPKCDRCSAPMREWLVILDRKFCKGCSQLPRCSECMLPCGKGTKYKDERIVCSTCGRSALFEEEEINTYFLKARAELKRITGLQSDGIPELKLVSQEKILALAFKELHHKPDGVIRGFYQRTEHYRDIKDKKPESVSRAILMLYGMRRMTYFITGVHEFTHDLIAEKFPRLKEAPSWVHEGICQYIASIAATHHKLNAYYKAIARHPDSAYGDGFRFFQEKFGKNNWSGLKTWMETVELKTLPSALPARYGIKVKK